MKLLADTAAIPPDSADSAAIPLLISADTAAAGWSVADRGTGRQTLLILMDEIMIRNTQGH